MFGRICHHFDIQYATLRSLPISMGSDKRTCTNLFTNLFTLSTKKKDVTINVGDCNWSGRGNIHQIDLWQKAEHGSLTKHRHTEEVMKNPFMLRKIAGTTANELILKTVYRGTLHRHLYYGYQEWMSTAQFIHFVLINSYKPTLTCHHKRHEVNTNSAIK